MWPFKKKKSKTYQMGEGIGQIDNNFESILQYDDKLKKHFENLINRFSERIWTPQVCSLFKMFAEELFQSFGINATFHVNSSTKGMGSFSVEIHPKK